MTSAPLPPRDGVYDANDPAQIERAEQADRQGRARMLEDVARVLEDPAGRRFVWRVLEAAHCFHPSFAADPHLTAFREGERNLGLMVLADLLEACPDRFAEMARENGGSEILPAVGRAAPA